MGGAYVTGGANAVKEEDGGLLPLAVEVGRFRSQRVASIESGSLFRCVSRLSNT